MTAQVAGQNPSPSAQARSAPVAEQAVRVSPQVVTVVHRLNGIKMLRLLRRSDTRASALVTFSDDFVDKRDVHTSIIAGLVLRSGKDIIARLPQAEAELEMPVAPTLLSVETPAPFTAPQPPGINQPGPTAAMPWPPNGSADLTVLGRDGQPIRARLLGLDGLTGLSLLRVGEIGLTPAREASVERLSIGQRVRLLAPKPASASAETTPPEVIYLRIGETQGRLTEIIRTPSGKVARLMVRAPDLSPAIVGGVALNEAGETVGIIETSTASEARIMPAAEVLRAAERILARQASVPRPWLGVRGEAVAATSIARLVSGGWTRDKAVALAGKHLGLLLTSVAPGTPAALADLRPGDVILRVNDGEVKSAEDFSFLLGEAGGGASVSFTILRDQLPSQELRQPPMPDALADLFKLPDTLKPLQPLTVNVKLSESLNPAVATKMAETLAATSAFADPLIAYGLETIPLSPRAAKRFGARGGLLVISVHMETAASLAGLRTADVIESINGQALHVTGQNFTFNTNDSTRLSLSVIREGQRLEIKLPLKDTKRH